MMRHDAEKAVRGWWRRPVITMGLGLWWTAAIAAQATGAAGTAGTEAGSGAKTSGVKTPAAGRVRPSKEAQSALRAAAELRKAAMGKKGKERQAILTRVAQAYVKVGQGFASEPVVAAQASFAAAENWRAAGNLDVAKDLYRRAIELDRQRFGARAHLQLGHLARREKDLAAAITAYRQSEALESGSSRGHRARLWVARCQLQQEGQIEVALRGFQAAIDKAPSPRSALDACNRLANALIKLGRLDQAQKVLTRAEQESKKPAGGTGKNAEVRQRGLAKAFASMSSRRALQRALDKKNKAHQDAVEVDKGRR